MLTSFAEARTLITDSPAPVLFIDTCIFLDIVRAPVRDEIPADTAKYTQELRARSCESPVSRWLVTSEVASTEWDDNITSVKLDLERGILKLEAQRNHFLSAAQATTNVKYQYGHSERGLNLSSPLKMASRAFLSDCLIVPQSQDHSLRAVTRMSKNLPPSRRGNSSVKDCLIFEMFLEFCRDFRAAGMTDKLVFVSSNTRDFGSSNEDGVQIELNDLGAEFTVNLPMAVAALDGRL